MQNSKKRRQWVEILLSEGKFAVNANHPSLFGLANQSRKLVASKK